MVYLEPVVIWRTPGTLIAHRSRQLQDPVENWCAEQEEKRHLKCCITLRSSSHVAYCGPHVQQAARIHKDLRVDGPTL